MSSAPVRSPQELRGLSLDELEALAQDIRQQILSACMKNGGHLGASLGAVELAIALHRVFDSPHEPIIWDVGHQAYTHKLLTGRWDRFASLRMLGGISGFLSRDENEHDVFGAGHSSTALSAAQGVAWAQARQHPQETPWTVAVVGDGGLTAGLAFEALNNLRAPGLGPLLVVLNDNQMSISRNVGVLPSILSEGKSREFFELFGFDYVGPVDGHDLGTLIGTLQGIRQQKTGKPILLHAMTQKGKGYMPAEESPAAYHGVSPVQEKIPEAPPKLKTRTFSDVFGQAMIRLAEQDPRVVAITAAMPEGTGLTQFAEKLSDRFFDVGIAEPHAVTFAAGLAARGVRPIVAIYSTFLQRSLDQIIHDVAIQKLPVIFAIDRAGVVGSDGPTHHGMFDLAYLSMIPELRVFAPSCLEDLPFLLEEALSQDMPTAIRYPRGSAPESFSVPETFGCRWHQTAEKPKLIAIALGAAAQRLAEAAQTVDPNVSQITVISTTHVKPIASTLVNYGIRFPQAKILCVEDGQTRGGFGQALVSLLGARAGKAELLGYPDQFVPQGTPAQLEELLGVSRTVLTETLRDLLK